MGLNPQKDQSMPSSLGLLADSPVQLWLSIEGWGRQGTKKQDPLPSNQAASLHLTLCLATRPPASTWVL